MPSERGHAGARAQVKGQGTPALADAARSPAPAADSAAAPPPAEDSAGEEDAPAEDDGEPKMKKQTGYMYHNAQNRDSAKAEIEAENPDMPAKEKNQAIMKKLADMWGKLDDAAKDYYRRWSTLIDVEAASAPPDGARAVVTKRPEERRGDACAVLQKVGETLSDDGVVVECSGASPFSVGDCVLLSAEGDLPTILARGGVVSVQADRLSIILRGSSAKPLPATLRVDGDGGATSARSQKAALTELLTSDNDVRDLIIAFREPAFDSQLGQKWLGRVFDDQAWAPPRWAGWAGRGAGSSPASTACATGAPASGISRRARR